MHVDQGNRLRYDYFANTRQDPINPIVDIISLGVDIQFNVMTRTLRGEIMAQTAY